MGFLSSSQQLSAALSSSNAPSAPRSPPLPAAPLPLISDLGFRVSFAPALLTATRSPLPAHRSLPPALCSPLPAPRASLPAPRSPLRPCAPVPPQLLSAALSSSQQLSAALSSSQQLSAALSSSRQHFSPLDARAAQFLCRNAMLIPRTKFKNLKGNFSF